MTIASTTSRMPNYTGNGAVNEYSFTFRIPTKNDILVTVKNLSDVETTLVVDTDYTVDGVDDTGGGSITLVDSGQAWLTGGFLTTNFELTLRRVVDLLQETDIRNQGDFFPEVHEDAFDYAMMVDQQQQDEINRSMKLPESVGSGFDTTLPATIVGATNSVLVVNATGDGFDVGSDIADLAALDAAYAGTVANAAAADASADAAAASAATAVAASQLISVANITGVTTLTSTAKGRVHNVTPSSSFNITLPAPAVGFYCWFKDVTGVFDQFPITLVRNGSETLEQLSASYVMESRFGIYKIYTDGTNYFLS